MLALAVLVLLPLSPQLAVSSLPPRQYFIREPDNQTAIQGEQVTLPCRVENKVGFLQWTRDGFGLGETRDLIGYPRYRLVGSDEEKDWTLEISPVLLEDDALFQCQVGAADGVKPIRSRFAQLTVYVPPGDPLIVQGGLIRAEEGTTTSIQCISPGGKPAADILWYDGDGDVVINNVDLRTIRLEDGKRFNTSSIVSFVADRRHHNRTFTCSASNIADRSRRTVSVLLAVRYAPSVRLTPSREVAVEGETLTYSCRAHANPSPARFSWWVDGVEAPGFNSNFFLIANISRVYHGSVVRCQVQNEVGISEETSVIQIKYSPRILTNPQTAAGEEGEAVTLHCEIDSNPPTTYTWTKGESRQAIGSSQNLTVVVSKRTEGEYYCHGISEGFDLVTTMPARVHLMGPPTITSSQVQFGSVGDNLRVECGGVAVPGITGVVWTYLGHQLASQEEKYQVLTSAEHNYGFRSTLLVRQSEPGDFGYYGCAVSNRLGKQEVAILLDRLEAFPLLMVVAIAVATVIAILLVATIAIYLRKGKSSVNQIAEKPFKPNNLTRSDAVERETDNWSQQSSEDLYNLNTLNANISEPAFSPKPDLLSVAGGYPPYGNFIRDYPPVSPFPPSESQTSLHSASQLVNQRHSTLLVSDPRFSAAYGNPYLRSQPAAPSLPHYSTFSPPDSSSPVLHSGYRHPVSGDLYAAVSKPPNSYAVVGGSGGSGVKANQPNHINFSHSFSESPPRESSEETPSNANSTLFPSNSQLSNANSALFAGGNGQRSTGSNSSVGHFITACNGSDMGTNV